MRINIGIERLYSKINSHKTSHDDLAPRPGLEPGTCGLTGN